MGLLNFVKEAGEKLFGKGQAQAAMTAAQADPASVEKSKAANDAAGDAILGYINDDDVVQGISCGGAGTCCQVHREGRRTSRCRHIRQTHGKGHRDAHDSRGWRPRQGLGEHVVEGVPLQRRRVVRQDEAGRLYVGSRSQGQGQPGGRRQGLQLGKTVRSGHHR